MTGDQVDDKTAPEAEQETKGRLEGAYWRGVMMTYHEKKQYRTEL